MGFCISMTSLYGAFLRRSVTAAGLISRTVDIDSDTTIHFWGPPPSSSAKPALVLIQGFGAPGIWQWRPQVKFFAGEFNVYVPDLVFFGESFSKSRERSEIFQATCIAKLLQNLGIPRYSVVGTSYGGFVAYRMTAMWPERVEKVVIASSAVNLRWSENEKLLQKQGAEKIEDLLLPDTAARLRKLSPALLYRAPYVPDFVLTDFIEKMYSENKKERLELLKGLSFGHDDNVTVSPLQQDVLVLWGEFDGIFLLEKAGELVQLLGRRAKLQVIKNTGHVPQLEDAAQFNKCLHAFLNALPLSS